MSAPQAHPESERSRFTDAMRRILTAKPEQVKPAPKVKKQGAKKKRTP